MTSSPYTIYAALVRRDVQEHPTHYNAAVRSDPEAHAYRLTDGLSPDDVRRLTRELRAEREKIARTWEATPSDWIAARVGCHWTHPKYPSAVVSSVVKRGADGAQFSGYVAIVNFAELGTFATRDLAQKAVAAHLGD